MVWQAAFGIAILLGLAWAFSENRGSVSWRLVVFRLLLQFACAFFLLRSEPVENAFEALNLVVLAVQAATREGTAFVFGYLGGGAAPFETPYPEHAFVLAFHGLPLILLVSMLSALLFHWRVLPLIVRGFAWCCVRYSASVGRSAYRRPPTYSSGWSRRLCSSVPTCGI